MKTLKQQVSISKTIFQQAADFRMQKLYGCKKRRMKSKSISFLSMNEEESKAAKVQYPLKVVLEKRKNRKLLVHMSIILGQKYMLSYMIIIIIISPSFR